MTVFGARSYKEVMKVNEVTREASHPTTHVLIGTGSGHRGAPRDDHAGTRGTWRRRCLHAKGRRLRRGQPACTRLSDPSLQNCTKQNVCCVLLRSADSPSRRPSSGKCFQRKVNYCCSRLQDGKMVEVPG